ncbi:unnamed protein product [Schistosoma rodhaini]|nr:unnamed protein product [Schistosoma rodhaini]
MQLDDFNFADDVAHLSHRHQQMQVKVNSTATTSSSADLNINKGKSEILKYNTENTIPIKLDGGALEDVESLTHLRSIIDKQGGSDSDVKASIGKAKATFLQL